MHIKWSDVLMNVGSVMLRWIIAQVFLTLLIFKLEVLLCFSIQEPVISHFNCMGTLLFDSVIDDAISSGVVEVDGCWRLWMPKFVES